MDDEQGGGGGNVLTNRVGPLAGWQWLALMTLLGVGFYLWQQRKASTAAAAGSAQQTAASVPSQDVPQFVINNQFPMPPTAPTPAATLPVNPTTGTVGTPATPTTPTPAPATPSSPTKVPPVAKSTRHGETVPVVAWTAKNPPWNSTISGIAAHYGIRNWQQVWGATQNAGFRAKRKSPDLIRPGDKVYVP